MKDLRKVKFTLEQSNRTIGDYESAGENANEIMKERTGVFHCWGNTLFYDQETGKYHDRTVCFVEEDATGKVYQVIPQFITFIK